MTEQRQDITPEELGFAVFCVENLAKRHGTEPARMFQIMTEDNDLLYNYLIPSYEPLHTQGMEYILDDLDAAMRSKGVEV